MSSLGKVQLCMCLVFGGERVGGNYCYIMEDSFFFLCRHTSRLESFNSMVLKYASKRIAFS